MNVIINYDHCISAALQMQRSGIYSSASNYPNLESILEVERISQRSITH